MSSGITRRLIGRPLEPSDEAHGVGAGNLSTNVRYHDDNRIGEVHVTTLTSQATLVQNLQQDVEDVWMCLQSRKEQDRVWTTANSEVSSPPSSAACTCPGGYQLSLARL